MRQDKDFRSRHFTGMWIGIGVALGTSFGVILDNLAIGIGLGISIGVVIGASLDKQYANKEKSDVQSIIHYKIAKIALIAGVTAFLSGILIMIVKLFDK